MVVPWSDRRFQYTSTGAAGRIPLTWSWAAGRGVGGGSVRGVQLGGTWTAGTGLDLTLHPFHERVARTNLLVVASETHQCFGEWEGWGETEEGERVRFDGLVGWADEARNRW